MQQAIRATGFDILTAATTDKAVAVTVSNSVAAIVVDAEMPRLTDWSVAQTFKMVRANLPVLLLDERAVLRDKLPQGVDAVIQGDCHPQIANILENLLDQMSDQPINQTWDEELATHPS